MPKLNINTEIEFEVLDCTDKLVFVTVGTEDRINTNLVKNLHDIFKKEFNAKRVLFMPKNMDIEALDIDSAIDKINDTIDELHMIKERLLEDKDD